MTLYNRRMSRLFVVFYIGFAVLLHANPNEWYRNSEMTTLYEAVTKISSESFYVNKQHTTSKNILKNYIYQYDPYGDYFIKEEYSAFKSMQSSEYVGIGMMLYQGERNGKVLCLPLDKHAEEQGISKYDELISVNGNSVKGKNFYLVSSWIRGSANSTVKLEVLKPTGKLHTVTFKRSARTFHSVHKVIEKNVVMIRIIRFMNNTPHELRNILLRWPKNIPVIIDLRGNGGGDFFAAMECADLLLPPNAPIISIETKKYVRDYRSSTTDIIKGRPIFLLQDKFTASASEVFIAALTQNKRVESIGDQTLGKGVVQKFIELSNGDALLLTYGEIVPPDGKRYHKVGLSPTFELSADEFLDTIHLSTN